MAQFDDLEISFTNNHSGRTLGIFTCVHRGNSARLDHHLRSVSKPASMRNSRRVVKGWNSDSFRPTKD